MKRKLITGVVAAVAALTIGCLAGCSGCNNPAPANGAIYQTETESFWVGVGHAYLSFEYQAEPADKTEDDTKIYGYVFKVMVSSGGDYENWLSGTWDLKEENNTYGDLTLTATWKDGENSTSLADAESGVAKTYSLNNGKYTIGVNLPSAGKIDFKLDPTKKLNGTTTPPEPTECTQHVDNNGDGKCDNCGEDMPSQEATVMATLSAETATIKSKLELKNDNTWTLSMCYYGDAYQPSADGRWSMNTQTYGITIVVENDAANMLAEDSYDLAINYETQKYSATIAITMPNSVPTIGGTALDFAFAQEVEAPAQKEVQKTLNANNGAQKAKIELYKDNTWEVSICFYGDSYSPMASGTWAMDSTTYNIVLTVVGDEANVLAEDTYTLNVDYQTFEYSADMTLTVPQVGALSFSFNSAEVVEKHYTVTYDLNYSGAPAGGTAETKTIKLNGVNKSI